MKISATVAGFADLLNDIEGDIAAAATGAMNETMPIAKQELREQTMSSGLGARMANTWRGEAYPKSRRSINPAGFIWSRAPDIVDSFIRGATIVPLAGRRWLAIPSQNVPRAGGRRGSTRRMTPEQVENHFNQDLFFRRGDNGRLLAFIHAVSARSGRGYRTNTRRRAAAGRVSKPVLMFTLVRSARMPKLIEINAVADRWTARFEAAFLRRIGTP